MSTADAVSDWADVGAIDDIPPLGSKVVATPTGNIAIFRTDTDDIFALKDSCPHKGGPLSQGIVHGRHVTCPLHGWTIGLEKGEAVAPDVGCAHVVAVRVENRRVLLARTAKSAA